MDYDMQVLCTLPTVFPNIRSLDWTDRKVDQIERSSMSGKEDLNSMMYSLIIKNWNGLESQRN
jgi:hypothetical protein